jgi:hypothetical protein
MIMASISSAATLHARSIPQDAHVWPAFVTRFLPHDYFWPLP